MVAVAKQECEMIGLIRGCAKVLSALAELDPDDVEVVLIEVARLNGYSVRKLSAGQSADKARTRRGRDADRKRLSRGQSPDRVPPEHGQDTDRAWTEGLQSLDRSSSPHGYRQIR